MKPRTIGNFTFVHQPLSKRDIEFYVHSKCRISEDETAKEFLKPRINELSLNQLGPIGSKIIITLFKLDFIDRIVVGPLVLRILINKDFSDEIESQIRKILEAIVYPIDNKK